MMLGFHSPRREDRGSKAGSSKLLRPSLRKLHLGAAHAFRASRARSRTKGPSCIPPASPGPVGGVGGEFRQAFLFRIDRLAQVLHSEHDVVGLQMPPALDLGLVPVLRKAFEILLANFRTTDRSRVNFSRMNGSRMAGTSVLHIPYDPCQAIDKVLNPKVFTRNRL
jgi:hypothetical protein